MIEILKDTIIDSIKLIPFLLVAFLIIEVIEHKLNKKVVNIVSKTKKLGPLYGSFFGLFPQCGFSVLATNLYVTRIISLGTLIAIYLSTSDEMLPILLSNNVEITKVIDILCVKFIVGMIFGFIIDSLYRKNSKETYDICDEENCHCKDHLVLSCLKHTAKTILYIFIVTLILNSLIYYIGEDSLNGLFLKNSFLSPFLSSLIGLIPNCSSSVILTELYLNNAITYGTMMSGLLTNSGLAILILFKSNKNIKENIFVLLLVYIIGVLIGITINMA